MHSFKYDLVPYTRGVGLEISPHDSKAFPHFIKWDSKAVGIIAESSLDFVYYDSSDSVFRDILDMSARLFNLVKINGFFILILNSDVSVTQIMKQHKSWELQEQIKDGNLCFYAYKKKEKTRKFTFLDVPVTPKCAVIRYGGIGDMMMASCIFPELKKQGFHVTLYTHVNSYEVVKHDPNIDRFVLQDSGQVPAECFRDFCIHTSSKFDRFINLSESIEGTLLSLPDRVSHYWPTAVRHSRMKDNYYKLTADISEVDFKPRGFFYPTAKEVKFSKKLIDRNTHPIIIWVLSGSSLHKFWPYQDEVLARILNTHKSANVFLVGDSASRLLEQGWENEPRIHKTSGKWSVRQTLTMCTEADLIVTPETGVFLAAQFTQVPKVLLLSHSSISNYAESLVNCHPITPTDCDCYPCHKLHYSFDYCTTAEVFDISGNTCEVAECQCKLSPDNVMDAINRVLGDKNEN